MGVLAAAVIVLAAPVVAVFLWTFYILGEVYSFFTGER